MYDLTVDSEEHTYFTNGILSHNSTVAAGYLLWYAMFKPDSFILITSYKFDGAIDIMDRIKYAYESIPDFIRDSVVVYNKKSIEFSNKSKIICTTTTENTGRGLSISLIYCDELAAVPPQISKAFYTSLAPTISTGGKIIVTSTPNTDEDQFAQIWFGANKLTDDEGNETEIGKNGFRPFMAIWSDRPDRDQKWADEQRAELGEARFRREHLGEFITFEETLINPIKLNELTSSQPIRKTGQVRWFREINPSNTYVRSEEHT